MSLAEGIQKYLEIAGSFGRPAPLARFGLSRDETEKLFSTWDEDYQINRYMLLTLEAAEGPARQIFLINGFECSHVCFQPDIQKLL